ncbi:RICIN domain-containing protein [Kribbella sp. NBC_01505]|uniref:RICIN domain-containing protein n=1 Tax=Kribbella sp. NBC_01505 TaxID=2903580 RepID=UPI003865BC5A
MFVRRMVAGAVALVLSGALLQAPAQAADEEPVYALMVVHSGKVMTVGSLGAPDPAAVFQRAYSGAMNQKFTVVPSLDRDGSFRIVDKSWWGGCIGVEGHSTAMGARLRSQNCDGSTSQLWFFDRDRDQPDFFVLVNRRSGLVATLASSSSADGVGFVQQIDHSLDTQVFYVAQL